MFCCQLSECLHAITVQVIVFVCESAPARQVRPAGGQPGREYSVAGEVRLIRPQPGLRRRRHPVDLRLEDNGHDDAIDGHRLAEDDAAAAQEALLISFDMVQESSQEVVQQVPKRKRFQGSRLSPPDEVLRRDPGHPDGTTQQTAARDENAPARGTRR